MTQTGNDKLRLSCLIRAGRYSLLSIETGIVLELQTQQSEKVGPHEDEMEAGKGSGMIHKVWNQRLNLAAAIRANIKTQRRGATIEVGMTIVIKAMPHGQRVETGFERRMECLGKQVEDLMSQKRIGRARDISKQGLRNGIAKKGLAGNSRPWQPINHCDNIQDSNDAQHVATWNFDKACSMTTIIYNYDRARPTKVLSPNTLCSQERESQGTR